MSDLVIKPQILFPEIYDLSDFISNKHPTNLNPQDPAYIQYWSAWERKFIEGIWGKDMSNGKGGWRYMGGRLAFYANACKIRLQQKGLDKVTFPDCTDVEWIMSYDWDVAKGFSGFEDDPKYTCFRPIGKLQRGQELTEKDKYFLYEMNEGKYLKKRGRGNNWKTYIDPLVYLHKTHPEALGLALYQNENSDNVVFGSRAFGKEMPNYTRILTYDGHKLLGDIIIGDKIIGRNGKQTNVIGVFPQGVKDIYEIEFADGRKVECGLDHQWSLFKNGSKNLTTITLNEILKNPIKSKHPRSGYNYVWRLPNIDPVQYPEKVLPIHPYIIGSMLGNGTCTTGTLKIATDDIELINRFKDLLPEYELKKDSLNNNYTIVLKDKIRHATGNPFRQEIIKLGLNVRCHDKFIPEVYKKGSVEQRFEIVKGLMGTDGSCLKEGNCEFTNTSKQLIDDLEEIIRSLGISCKRGFSSNRKESSINGKVLKRTTNIIYRLYINTGKEIFFVKRKLERQKKDKVVSNPIINIIKKGKTEQTCIAVDAIDSLFLVENYIPTHNTYWQANGVALHSYKFFGCTRYDSSYFNAVKEQRGQKIFTRSAIEKNINDLISATRISLQFQENDLGSYRAGRIFKPGFFHRSFIGVLQGNNVKNPYSQSIKLKIQSSNNEEAHTEFSWITLESGASLNFAISTANNPAPGTGGRYSDMINDEIGRNPNLRRGREQERDCMIMNFKNGSDSMSGTSGELENVTDALYIFNNPEENDVLAHDDIYEFSGHKIGRFLPAYYADRKYKDELGNTDIIRAFKSVMEERKAFIDLGAIERYNSLKLNRPIIPSEMAGGGEDYYLPKAAALKRRIYLERSKLTYTKRQKGKFEHVDNDNHKVAWVSTPSAQPVEVYQPQRQKVSTWGCVEIIEFPVPNLPQRKYWNNLYKVILDPIKDDGKEGELPSLCVAAVHKGFAANNLDKNSEIDNIVAWVVLRREEVEAGAIIAFQLAIFYNAYLLFEGNVGPIMTLARMKNWEYLLQPTPYASLKTINKKVGAGWGYGVIINAAESLWSETKFNEWLTKKWKIDEDGTQLFNVDKLYWLFLLDEISKYKRGKNFDAISCMKVLMFWLHQEEISPVQIESEEVKSVVNNFYKELRQVEYYDTTFNYEI